MNTVFKLLATTGLSAAMLALSACAALAAPRHEGHVAEIDTTEVEVCSTGAASPTVGDEVQLVRSVHVGDPKQTTRAERTVGVARIAAVHGEGCFNKGHPGRRAA